MSKWAKRVMAVVLVGVMIGGASSIAALAEILPGIDDIYIIYASGDSASNVTKNMTFYPPEGQLPQWDIMWESSRPDIVSSTGTVTPPSADTSVKLTMWAKQRFFAHTEWQDLREFTITVKKGNGSDNSSSRLKFGAYPQTKVTDAAIITELNRQYPNGNQDVFYGGNQYRKGSGTSGWFKYEPIYWRVLAKDSSAIFVIAERILDARPYHSTYADVTWATSSLRSWLNNTFFSLAFTSVNQGLIQSTSVVNSNNAIYGTLGGITTTDKIYLLSAAEAKNTAYGFSSDATAYDIARRAQGSDYAKSIDGLFVNTESAYYGNSFWWSRSPGEYANKVCGIRTTGYFYDDGGIVSDVLGVRPVMRLDPAGSYEYVDDNWPYDTNLTGLAAAQAVLASLQIGYTVGDSANSVTKNLMFPTTNYYNFAVTWKSSDSNTVSNSGVVTRPLVNDKVVTITVSVTYDRVNSADLSVEKTFTLTVKGPPPIEPEKPVITYHDFTATWDEELFSRYPNASGYPGTPDWMNLAIISGILSGLAYSKDDLSRELTNLGFEDTAYLNESSGFLFPGYAFTHKKVMRNGQETDLVLAIFRGTDWSSIGNGLTDVTTDVAHMRVGAIPTAADYAAQLLDAYLKIPNNKLNPQTAVFLVTGHSLGGGMANCVANSLSAKYGDSNVFAFTFASPKTTLLKFNRRGNITNIISETDFHVHTGILLAEGTRFGKDYYVSTPQSIMYGKSHNIDSYIDAIKNKSGDWKKPLPYNVIVIMCPVDVEVYNNKNALLGKTVNNTVDASTTIPAYVVGDEKYFIVPDESYTIRFTATDTGTMDYSVIKIDPSTEEIIAEKNFVDVALQSGKKMMSEVGGEITTSNVRLFVTGDNGEKQKEVLPDGSEIPFVGFTLTYDANGGTGGPPPEQHEGGVWFPINHTIFPTRVGYIFVGWANPSNKSKVVFEAGEASNARISGNATLYAVWLKWPLENPRTLEVNGSQKDYNLTDGGTLYFKATVPKAGNYDLCTITSGSDTLDVRLYDANGVLLGRSINQRDSYVTTRLAEGETYYYTVTLNSQSGTSSIRLSFNEIKDNSLVVYNISLWGKLTKYESTFWNWLMVIFLFGWIWMAF